MLDIKFIRENTDLVKEAARKKHITVDIDRLVTLDDERRVLLQSVEEKRALQNDATSKMPAVADPAEREALIAEMKTVKESLTAEEEKLKRKRS
jgi:seryl-tRNA synthetase